MLPKVSIVIPAYNSADPLANGAYLWDRYLRAALTDTEGCRRILIFYDHLIADPETEITALIDFCALPPHGGIAALAESIRAELRHHQP